MWIVHPASQECATTHSTQQHRTLWHGIRATM